MLLPLRIMLVGKKIGPGVFDIAEIIGKEETIKMNYVLHSTVCNHNSYANEK